MSVDTHVICVYASVWCMGEGVFEHKYRGMYDCVHVCAKRLWVVCGDLLSVSTGGVW